MDPAEPGQMPPEPDQDQVTSNNANRKSAQDMAAGLIGSIYADSSLDATAQKNKIDQVTNLRSIASRPTWKVDQTDTTSTTLSPALALTELEGMNRAAEVKSLDRAATALAGTTVVIAGLFIGIGFSTGDFVHMIRNSLFQGIAFLILVGVALLLSAFAFAINGYRSNWNLRLERTGVYLAIVCASAAFTLAAWGLAQGASAEQTRPTISTSLNTVSGTRVLSVSASSLDVPRKEHLTVIVWGYNKTWTVLDRLETGPAPDGTDRTSFTINDIASYTNIEVVAGLSATAFSANPSKLQPCPASCAILNDLQTASPTPTAMPLK